MSDPDPEKLRELEARIEKAKAATVRPPSAMKRVGQGEMAWRMVLELVTGMVLGLGFGYGLDLLLGTKPILMVIFVLLGFAAGVRTMLRTASEMTQPVGDAPDLAERAGEPPQEKGK